jgi:hypothetical protein
MVQQQLLLVKIIRKLMVTRLKAYLEREKPSLHINRGSVPSDTIVMQCFSGCLMYPQRYHIQIAVSDEGISQYVTQWFFSQTESKLWVLKATANIENDSKPSRLCLLESLTNLNQPDWSTNWSPTVCQPTMPPKRSHNRHPMTLPMPLTPPMLLIPPPMLMLLFRWSGLSSGRFFFNSKATQLKLLDTSFALRCEGSKTIHMSPSQSY